MKRFVAALLGALVAAPAVAADSELQFPSGEKFAPLHVFMRAEEQAAEQSLRLFFTKFFAQFDRDNDGSLSEAEVKRVFPFPLPGGKEVAANFAEMDTNRDDKVSPAEVQAYYRKHGFAPVTVTLQSAPAETLALGDALFRHLDRDADGKLSAAELRQAAGLLKRLDENEDEVLTAAELLGANTPKGEAKAAGLKLAPAGNQPDAILSMSRTKKSSVVGKNKAFKLSAAGSRLQVPGGTCSLAFDSADPTAGFVAARDFYLAQFKAAAGDKPAPKALFADDPTAQVLDGLFDAADRNADGKLTRAELDSFFGLIEMGVSCRVVVAVTDRGRNLFDLFDANGDGKLDLDELTRAGKALPDELAGDKPLERAAVPASYRLVVGRGPVGDSFGPVPFGAAAKPKPPAPAPVRGPKWFLAMDRNGDGFVSPKEFVGTPELFARLDANKDGRISAEEAEAFKE